MKTAEKTKLNETKIHLKTYKKYMSDRHNDSNYVGDWHGFETQAAIANERHHIDHCDKCKSDEDNIEYCDDTFNLFCNSDYRDYLQDDVLSAIDFFSENNKILKLIKIKY